MHVPLLMNHPFQSIAVLLVVVSLAACAHFPVNQPMNESISSLVAHPRDQADDLLVVLTFSGGGMRASALSYGVLQSLADSEITWKGRPRRLLDEVDVISAVSGGSFTAAYFGLFGDRIFRDYEEAFLKRNVDRELIGQLFSPSAWLKLGSKYYDRSEMAEDYYDQILFDGAIFADFKLRPGPQILINATDMTLGDGFTFDTMHYDLICSDLDQYSVARAVTASSAVPGVFSTVTLLNHAGECNYRAPAWVQSVLAKPDSGDDRINLARKIDSYQQVQERPYIHLLDGGLADNLGLRALMDKIRLHHRGPGREPRIELDSGLEKILIIVVNAAASPNTALNHIKDPPSVIDTVDVATTVQVNRYNEETQRLFRQRLEEWRQAIRVARCGDEHCDAEPDIYLVNASLQRLKNEDERDFLQHQPTSFALKADAVDRLIDAGRRLLVNSTEMQQFLGSVR
ncbi:MAG: patatin-like phospholipase family protein [Thiothrix sp.]|nr:MAG: patatin-like phospholipase family protein [Thiothrix sp.]